jgi:hypothetical protein
VPLRAFDLLHLGADDLRPLELRERRAMLRKIMPATAAEETYVSARLFGTWSMPVLQGKNLLLGCHPGQNSAEAWATARRGAA